MRLCNASYGSRKEKMESVQVEDPTIIKIKIRQKLAEWSSTKSLALASEICEILDNNFNLLS